MNRWLRWLAGALLPLAGVLACGAANEGDARSWLAERLAGGEAVVAGRDGWLYLPADLRALTLPDLADYSSDDLAGQRVVLNVFPSVDTRVCALSVRRFNELAAGLDGTTVVCISHDLPYALGRFCGAEGIDRVVTASALDSSRRETSTVA